MFPRLFIGEVQTSEIFLLVPPTAKFQDRVTEFDSDSLVHDDSNLFKLPHITGVSIQMWIFDDRPKISSRRIRVRPFIGLGFAERRN